MIITYQSADFDSDAFEFAISIDASNGQLTVKLDGYDYETTYKSLRELHDCIGQVLMIHENTPVEEKENEI